MIEIRRYVSSLLSSNMYVVVEGRHAIVIDPFEDISAAEGLNIDYILLTHEHYDHISGVNLWKKARDAPVLCSKPCAENIRNPKKNLAYYFKDFCELQTWIKIGTLPSYDPEYACEADVTFDDHMSFEWHGHQWDLFELPGHSMGSIGMILDGSSFFSGDSLLENFDISLRIPGGSKKKWNETGAKRIAQVPEGIRVYPGHFTDFIYKNTAPG